MIRSTQTPITAKDEDSLVLLEALLASAPVGIAFLDGNLCSVYEARPHNCENFPHLVRGEGSFVSRMWELKDRACYCPIVYNALDAYKKETKFTEAGSKDHPDRH